MVIDKVVTRMIKQEFTAGLKKDDWFDGAASSETSVMLVVWTSASPCTHIYMDTIQP